MKVQCDVCEKAEAEVLCCADEAVLCSACDANVHAANKVSQKHQRVFLLKHPSCSSPSSSSYLPLCDTCKEKKGYVFCLEDRALLCKHCDVSSHAANPYASSHQRFLISGTKVSLLSSSTENDDNNACCSISSSKNNNNMNQASSSLPMACTMESSFGFLADDRESIAASTETTTNYCNGPSFHTEPRWPLFDEIYDIQDFSFCEFSEVGSSSKN